MPVEPKINRIPVMMTDDLLTRIDDYRFANRIGTRAEAIRILLNQALTQPEETIGTWIAETRGRLGITQAEFAKRLGVAQAMVSKWERGLEQPRHESICAINKIWSGLA